MRLMKDGLVIGPAWAGHPVGFALLTTGQKQFVAYYDEERHMTVASRLLTSTAWEKHRLPEQVGWDSHNGLALALDANGRLHLSGNMHGDPLVYFRSREPDSSATFERAAMTGSREDLVTYPQFFPGPRGALCFGYRHGSSGKGDQIYNRYDAGSDSWHRLAEGPAVSGEGIRNAYLDGPHSSPDGWFHLCWVWRDTPDCATNHTVCYARSRDLVNWMTSDGSPLPRPITFATAEVVDPVQTGQGLMNGNVRLGFDLSGNPVISYHKLDTTGNTQVFHARWKTGSWTISQASAWIGAWLPEGHGTIRPEIHLDPVRPTEDGRLIQPFWTDKLGHRQWELDPDTLKPRQETADTGDFPPALEKPTRPGFQVNWKRDSSGFALRWESLAENRDQPSDSVPPSRLQVFSCRGHDLQIS